MMAIITLKLIFGFMKSIWNKCRKKEEKKEPEKKEEKELEEEEGKEPEVPKSSNSNALLIQSRMERVK